MKAWLLRRVGILPAAAAVVAVTTTALPPGLDPAGVQAFLDEVRRVLAAEDRRSDTFGQRAQAVLGFDGVIISVLFAGLALIHGRIKFTPPFLFNVVCVDVLLVASALTCLIVLHPRKVTIPANVGLRGQWASFIEPGSKVLPAAQIANSFLGAQEDPLAAASREATSRGAAYKTTLYLLVLGVVALGVLAGQALARLT